MCMVSSANLCIICKGGRNLCGNNPCPLLTKFNMENKVFKTIGNNFFGKSPSIFVGRSGYPNVSVGPMGSLQDDINDNPSELFGKSYQEIINQRSLLLRSKHSESVFSKSKFVEQNQEIALSSRNVDIELEFKNKPLYNIKFSDVIQPMGPSVSVKKFGLAENVPIPRRVDSLVNDEVLSADASFALYKFGYDVSKISTILSSGILGKEKKKKLVPTRWSITAVDDIMAKKMMIKIREYREINEFMVFSSFYMDNRFEGLLIPGSWEYENFETWAPGSSWGFAIDNGLNSQAQNSNSNEIRVINKPQTLVEYEPFEGRTKYADQEGGGYYAARIAVAEKLYQMKRQAKAVVFREVHEGYIIPLGVWQVRENVRNAVKSVPKRFSTMKEALEDISSRLRIDMKKYVEKSKILRQRRLADFLF